MSENDLAGRFRLHRGEKVPYVRDMKTTLFLLSLIAFTAGCGDNNNPEQTDAGALTVVTTPDAGTDACIAANANCGCIYNDFDDFATGLTTTWITCPGSDAIMSPHCFKAADPLPVEVTCPADATFPGNS